jgi:quercetin dioxygenase-like cupin family protein
MKIIHETEVEETRVPGRFLRWIAKDGVGLDPEFCSSCVMRVEPGFTVTPAHSHPNGEELIYIIEGEGKVFVDGIIKKLEPGTAVLFEKGSKHMVRNSGQIPMKVICFFAPKTSLDEYEFHYDINFDEGEEQC